MHDKLKKGFRISFFKLRLIH